MLGFYEEELENHIVGVLQQLPWECSEKVKRVGIGFNHDGIFENEDTDIRETIVCYQIKVQGSKRGTEQIKG